MDLKIDEEHIEQLCKDAAQVMKSLLIDAETLQDKKQCNFKRYMALVRLMAQIKGAEFGLNTVHHGFHMGFDLQHPIFQTKEAIERGWDSVKIKENPFFVQPEAKAMEIDLNDLPDEVKELIKKTVEDKLSKKKNTRH